NRFEPSALTIHEPAPESTSSLPPLGRATSARSVCSLPTAWRTERTSAGPAGLTATTTRATIAAAAVPATSPPGRRAGGRGSYSAKADRTTCQARSVASCSPGRSTCSSLRLTEHRLLQSVEASAQARVDRAPRKVEELG